METVRFKEPKWHNLVLAAVLVVFSELGWLGLIYPLVPSTREAWTITLLMPLPIGGYIYLVVRAIWSLSLRSNSSTLLNRGEAALLAISVGVLIFFFLWIVEYRIDGQFHYGIGRK